MPLEWRGRQVEAKMQRAAIRGINTTMQACLKDAKENHGPGAHAVLQKGFLGGRFESDTGELVRSIRMVSQAKGSGRGVVGTWGSIGSVYALRIEMGFQGADSLGRVFAYDGHPFLRPAAQQEYPKLASRIRKEFRRI